MLSPCLSCVIIVLYLEASLVIFIDSEVTLQNPSMFCVCIMKDPFVLAGFGSIAVIRRQMQLKCTHLQCKLYADIRELSHGIMVAKKAYPSMCQLAHLLFSAIKSWMQNTPDISGPSLAVPPRRGRPARLSVVQAFLECVPSFGSTAVIKCQMSSVHTFDDLRCKLLSHDITAVKKAHPRVCQLTNTSFVLVSKSWIYKIKT